VIANGERIGQVDQEQCPIPEGASLLPVVATI
jgi:hypothetical protein